MELAITMFLSVMIYLLVSLIWIYSTKQQNIWHIEKKIRLNLHITESKKKVYT